MTTTRKPRRRTLAASATTAIAVGLISLGVAPAAHADPLPTLCNPAVDHTTTEPYDLQVTPSSPTSSSTTLPRAPPDSTPTP